MTPSFPDLSFSPENRGFCVPPNHSWDILTHRIETNLDKIKIGENFAGIERELPLVTAPVEPLDLVRRGRIGRGEMSDFVPTSPPPRFRYSFLLNLAQQQASLAQHYESYLLGTLEKLDKERYSLLQARNDLKLKKQHGSLEVLKIREAENGIETARIQLDRSKFSERRFGELIRAGQTDWEGRALDLQKSVIAANTAANVAYGVAAVKESVKSVLTLGILGKGAKSSAQLSQSLATTLGSTASLSQSYATFERREQDWQYQQALSAWDAQIGESSVEAAQARLAISMAQGDLAQLTVELAEDTVHFLARQQFAGVALHQWMSRELKRLHRQQLNMAVSTSLAAQQALAFELQEPVDFIGRQYWQSQHEGLLGSEKLRSDLDRLESHRVEKAERRREITKTISLSRMMPSQFQQFRETGKLTFTTPMYWFDRDFPGQYLRLIKNVELSVIALTPPGDGIHANLFNPGLSRVMLGFPWVEPKVISRPAEGVSLSAPFNASGLFQLRFDDPMLLPFEGSGVETTWTLEMSKGANRMDFDTLHDVLMTIRYTAKEDAGYRKKVIARLGTDFEARMFYDMKSSFPDTWYHFHNPQFRDVGEYSWKDGRSQPYTLNFTLDKSFFPPNEKKIGISNLQIAIDQEALEDSSQPTTIPMQLTLSTDPPIVKDFDIKDGLVEEQLEAIKGESPFGEWSIRLRNEVCTNPATANSNHSYYQFCQNKGSDPQTNQVILDEEKVLDTFKNLMVIFDYHAQLDYAQR